MDIENMHPFCLPFSLCHDATSSSITESLYDIKHDKQNDGEKLDGKEEKSGLGSTMDDQSSLTPQRLIADEDHLLESSLGGSSHDAFDLLDLDMEMRTDTIFELNDIDNDDICNKEDDWFSSHECSLFSTLNDITSDHHSSRSSLRPCLKGPSSISTLAHNHQVFQHIVDPIDIKSSPTLAQLNLNSNDDPTDGLWGSSGATATTSTNSTLISSTAHHHHHHHHLNSSSTNSDLMSSAPSCNSSTETNSLMMGCSRGNFPSSCNHTNSYNHQSNIQAKDTHSHLNNLHTCQHHPYHHTQRYPQQSNTDTQSSQSHSHSTCLAVAPFRKEAHQVQRGGTSAHTGCCLNHCQHLERFNTSSPSAPAQSSNCMTDKKSHCFQHHNCHRDQELSLGKSQTLTGADKNSNQVQRSLQQRSQSPAPLVTSSSSPLSSLTTLNPGLENRQLGGENKLKENIEYLTVLLCNGSKKIDEKVIQKQTSQDQQQQSSISSSMVKSYSTLAQSLSTEPKLLGSYNQSKQLVHNGSYIQSNHNNNLPNTAVNQTNSSHETHQCAVQGDGHLRNGLKLTCPNHCFKPANVESSISAADSTAENQLRPNHPGLSPCYVSQNGQALTNSAQMQISRAGEMKVLSSLLSSNKCIPQGPADLMMNAPFTSKDGYNQAPCVTWTAPCGQSMNQPMHQVPAGYNSGMYQSESSVNRTGTTYNQHDNSSIPVNGRPITLTPLVSNNVSIPQRQQAASQPQNAKVKTSTFVQPASPSTSSTTSSSGNTEISPSFALTKKQKSAASGKGNSQSVRSGRPSSMSTDCSLSSHDEGFSSQIDQDDCANSVRDSDDESDIDSDDESFYGDYTNNDLIGASISDNPECKWTLNMGRTRRNGQRRFFWQYNVQSKGPKGTRICPADGAEDPFVLPEASDPVFSNECQVEGVKHSGKARRGDGNDLTPNPRKLLMIGLELKKLSKIINDLAPVTDLPINARNKTRKEKNKLASRACRLKKKAQHEANKIKLYGLQREHQQIVMAIFDARKMIHKALTQQRPVVDPNDTVLSTNLKRLLEQCLMTVAGQTSDYVNSVLEKVVSGCIDGGLQT